MVRYDGAQYPGEVTTVMRKEYEVSIVIMAGNLWPSTPDKAFCELGDIVQVISTPGSWLQRPVQGDLIARGKQTVMHSLVF